MKRGDFYLIGGIGLGVVATALIALLSKPSPRLPQIAALPVVEAVEPEIEIATRSAIDGDAIRTYILDNPEVIREALVILEQRRAVEDARAEQMLISQNADAIFDDGFSYVGGNPDGDITLVEFHDYRCGFCKRAHEGVQQLVAEDGNIRLVVKEFPILGDDSMLTSRLAIAAKIADGDEAYKRLSNALMQYGGPVNQAALARLAKSADVDFDVLNAMIEDEEISNRITQTRQLARTLSISGTPTFIIGDRMVRGFLPPNEMKQMVELVRGELN